MTKKIRYLMCIGLLITSLLVSCSQKQKGDWVTIFNAIHKKYPKAPLQDVIKLLYIGQFGNRHLLKDSAAAKNYFYYEWGNITPDNGNLLLPLRPDSTWYLLDLKVAKQKNLKAEKIWKIVENSAYYSTADTNGFIQSVRNYKRFLSETGPLSISNIRYLDSLLGQIPAYMHHSDAFKRKFNPAYRIIHRESWQKFIEK